MTFRCFSFQRTLRVKVKFIHGAIVIHRIIFQFYLKFPFGKPNHTHLDILFESVRLNENLVLSHTKFNLCNNCGIIFFFIINASSETIFGNWRKMEHFWNGFAKSYYLTVWTHFLPQLLFWASPGHFSCGLPFLVFGQFCVADALFFPWSSLLGRNFTKKIIYGTSLASLLLFYPEFSSWMQLY